QAGLTPSGPRYEGRRGTPVRGGLRRPWGELSALRRGRRERARQAHGVDLEDPPPHAVDEHDRDVVAVLGLERGVARDVDLDPRRADLGRLLGDEPTGRLA